MYENNKDFCDKLATLFNQKSCNDIFQTRPGKAWQMWERHAGQDMQKFILIIPIENKLEFYRWIHLHIVDILRLYCPDLENPHPDLLNQIQTGFNKALCNTLFHKDADRVFKTWEACGSDVNTFLRCANIRDKWAVLLCFYNPAEHGSRTE